MSITFAQPVKDIPRKRGLPQISPPEGGPLQSYSRPSTLAKVLDDKTALTIWKQRMVAVGLGLRPDLAQLAAVAKDDKRQLDEIVEQAMAAADTKKAANLGNALHKLTEHLDRMTMPERVPGELLPDLDAYEQAMQGIQILAVETFVVTDELRAAGTFDRLVQLPDGRIMVADLKTGKHEPSYPHASTIQIAIYSRGHLYDPDRGRVGYLPDLGVDQNHGLLIHLPAGSGTCDLYLLDIDLGWSLACTAYSVQQVFKTKPISAYSPKKVPTT